MDHDTILEIYVIELFPLLMYISPNLSQTVYTYEWYTIDNSNRLGVLLGYFLLGNNKGQMSTSFTSSPSIHWMSFNVVIMNRSVLNSGPDGLRFWVVTGIPHFSLSIQTSPSFSPKDSDKKQIPRQDFERENR